MTPHSSSLKHYVVSWLSLLLLTALTVAAASLPHGPWSIPIALAIATAKAALVLFVFMHLLEHPPAVRLVLATSLVFVGLMILFVQLDVTRRFPLARPTDPGHVTDDSFRAAFDD
jgi:cytochrome c oxidase subunit IV